jgi:hypothetical protein
LAKYDPDLRDTVSLTTKPTGGRWKRLFRISKEVFLPLFAVDLSLCSIGFIFVLWIEPSFLPTMIYILFGLITGATIMSMMELRLRIKHEFGSVNPWNWLDSYNAYGVVHHGQTREETTSLCEDICTGRWRRDTIYVYFENPNDAAIYRLTRPW